MFVKGLTLALCFGLLWVRPAHSKILLVSDIDDTLKIAHVNSFIDKIDLAFAVQSRFKGMSRLYQAVEADQAGFLKIFYLSNAPDWLMWLWHDELLYQGQFPYGSLHLREGDSEDFHKILRLREWINKERPEKVILIGDNGERDAQFYHQISNKYAEHGIRFYQFIRMAYGSGHGHKLYSGQIGFVTPIEIAMEFKSQGLLSQTRAEALIVELEKEILAEDYSRFGEPAYFPYWLDCSTWSPPIITQTDPGYLALEKTKKICFGNLSGLGSFF